MTRSSSQPRFVTNPWFSVPHCHPDALAQMAVEGRDRIVIGWDLAAPETPRTAAWYALKLSLSSAYGEFRRDLLPPRFGPMQGVEKKFRYE